MSGLLLLRRRLYQGCHSSRLNQIRHYALIGKPSQSQKPTWSLPDSPARTRFAPSPTGYLHLGSLRTALFNYLLAQATGGQFIIRLEDTDQTRFVEDAEQRLYQDLTWAGLSWDEGPDRGGPYGPYKQSDRLDLYRQHASMLLERDHAFRCFCSKEELEFNLKQSTSSGATAHYPGTCTGISQAESDRRAANGEPHTIRFKSSETPVSAPDLVYGAYKKAEREDNFIIMKSDGYPTYHFANVVDDHFMKITHVIRGAEWLISTPKHVELYNAFGWQPPNFAHVGLLVDQQRQKLSKRDIDNIGISVFRDMKILPEALLNFSVLLGWDPGLQNKPHLDKRGRLTLDEMKQNFTTKFTRGDIVVDLVKLKYFQNRFIRDLISGEVADPPALANRILKPIQAELQRLNEKLLTHKPRNKTPGSVLPAGMDELDFDHLSTRMDLAFEETYIHAVLKAWKGPIDDHSQFIRDNMYAFWSPSKPAYKDSFADLQEGMRRIVIRKPTRSLGNTDISKVIIHLRNRLALIPHDEWTLEAVGNRAKELADAVEYYDTKKEQVMNHGAGWKFFRWALFNGMSGLSVVPMMLILGREETLQRLREARRVAARREEVALNSMKEKMQELKDSRVRIAYLGNPEKEDTKGFQEAEVMEARNVKVAIKKDDPEETISDTEHFLRAMHEARPDQGPFPSQVPKREYTLNASPPVQFLNRTEFKSGYRSLLHGTNSEGQYAPPLWHVAESRKEYVLSRMEEETVFSRRRPNELGPFGSGELGPQQHEVAERRFFPPTRGPMLRPKHLDGSEPENTLIPPRRLSGPPGPPGPRGPYLPAGGEPVADYRTHVEEIRARNQENKIKSDKKLRRDRCKQMKPDYRLEPLGSIPRDMVAPGPGPFYAGSVVDHPLRPPFPNRAVHAKAAENERRVRQDMDKKSKVSLAEAERNLQRSWLERGNQ